MSINLGIWGWWQGKNLGDNWIKRTLFKFFPEATFIDTTVKDFSKYDFIICGGGGLYIYDVIEPWASFDYKVPYGMLGLGAEFPHETNKAYELSRKSQFFFLRDKYSLDCMKINDIERSYDVTFLDPLKWINDNELKLDNLLLIWRDGKKLCQNSKFEEYIKYSDNFNEYEKIINDNFKDIRRDDFQTESNNIEKVMQDSGFVISGRFHGIVAAIQKGLPCIAIDICPKIRVLMEDCGLGEYCIKVNEVNKLCSLITKAKKNYKEIRNKQKQYTLLAQSVLLKNIAFAKASIDKAVRPLKVIHYGSYWMKDNDVVKVMLDDLKKVSDTLEIDLNIYSKQPDNRVKVKFTTLNGTICVLDFNKVKEDIEKFNPEAIVFNSGGIVPEDELFEYMKNKKIVTIGISLSDPDVFPYNGAIYSHKFDLFYTNSKYSFINDYNKLKTNINILPFAASVEHHFYMPEIEKAYDIVVVGHARPDRLKVIGELEKKFKVGTYGNGWPNSLGSVHGQAHVEALNQGLMYLSFAKTNAGFDNIKVGLFEAIACKQVVITKYMEELLDCFEIGKEIICYKDETEIDEIVSYYLTHRDELEEIRERSYSNFLRNHTYDKRWLKVKDDVFKYMEGINE